MQVHSERPKVDAKGSKEQYVWIGAAIMLAAALVLIFVVAPHMTGNTTTTPCMIVVGHYCPHNTTYSNTMLYGATGLMMGSLLVAITLISRSTV